MKTGFFLSHEMRQTRKLSTQARRKAVKRQFFSPVACRRKLNWKFKLIHAKARELFFSDVTRWGGSFACFADDGHNIEPNAIKRLNMRTAARMTNWILQSLFSDLSSPFKEREKVRKSFLFLLKFRPSCERASIKSLNISISPFNRNRFSFFVCFLTRIYDFCSLNNFAAAKEKLSNEFFLIQFLSLSIFFPSFPSWWIRPGLG